MTTANAAAADITERVRVELDQIRAKAAVSPTAPLTPPLQGVSNPFVYRGPLWTVREVLVVVVFGWWLLPLRLLALCLVSVPAYVLLRLSISFGFDPEVPMTGWRRAVQLPSVFLLRAWLFVCGMYWVETTGRACSVSEARTVVCAPHSTLMDTTFLFYWLRMPSAISKLENLSYPLFGVLFRASQVITVDRSNKDNRQQAFEAMKRRAVDEREKRHLLVFPEGTCTNREALITFKLGAFAAGKPVQPVALEWPSMGGFDLTWSSASAPGRMVLALHLLCQPYVRCRVHFLPVYVPSAEEQQDAHLFARNVRQVIATKLHNLPCTEHSIEDMFLAKEARAMNVDLSFEMRELQRAFNIDVKQAKLLLRRYGRLFRDGRRVSEGEFAQVLGVGDSPELAELFGLLVSSSSDPERLDFKHFLVASWQMSQAFDSVDAAKEAVDVVWEACGGDEDKRSVLSLAELRVKLADIFPGKQPSRQAVKRVFATGAGGGGDKKKKKTNSKEVDYDAFSRAMLAQTPVLFAALRSLGGGGEADRALQTAA